jgi:divalent metal cation (Fe/Co/Zn/Cd) transporter
MSTPFWPRRCWAGLVLNALVGWWWADPVAAYVILAYGAKEGWAALHD